MAYTIIDRQPLSQLSTNRLNRSKSDLVKPQLPKLSSVLASSNFQISKPSPKINIFSNTNKHAEKLKYRLKLAYYKLRTNQISIPVNELINDHQNSKIIASTPSLTRHISLLAASTPLNSSHFQISSSLKKKNVSFDETRGSYQAHDQPPLARINEHSLSVSQISLARPSLKIQDLVDANNNRRTDITPIKSTSRIDDNGDIIMSSPTKKVGSSTPGSYGAAKSLLQLSLIS
ncbi:hypothetical protein WICMUC_003699 [Wickerhamomyces mucosus]|uniref:Uncharacterized protein n=1 Tax=Wickerhamomyces mucosus TaxID=1378264 RepID=A0A9P8TC62_9ASCO|nr:hypothetical protein WICMUC_003699 [Wickerhamomyces mucosus]